MAMKKPVFPIRWMLEHPPTFPRALLVASILFVASWLFSVLIVWGWR